MQRTILNAIISLGFIATAHAQTAPSTGTDPLSVPTLPAMSSFPTGTSGGLTGETTTGPLAGGASDISLPGSRSAQAPLQLPGEGPDTSMQGASTTVAVPGVASTICPPPIPSTDGGSANITAIGGFSPGGC